jgi:hypothetical protein
LDIAQMCCKRLKLYAQSMSTVLNLQERRWGTGTPARWLSLISVAFDIDPDLARDMLFNTRILQPIGASF